MRVNYLHVTSALVQYCSTGLAFRIWNFDAISFIDSSVCTYLASSTAFYLDLSELPKGKMEQHCYKHVSRKDFEVMAFTSLLSKTRKL